MMPPYAAVVLAGGDGRRLGGTDKAALAVGGGPMLERCSLPCRTRGHGS
jgi:molybdopterin-guanine dinucleotide biosynthesis protein A